MALIIGNGNTAIIDFVEYIHDTIKGPSQKRFAYEAHNMFLNPDLVHLACCLDSPSSNLVQIDRKARQVVWGNPDQHAIHIAHSLDRESNPYHSAMVNRNPLSVQDFFWRSRNHHPEAVNSILQRYDTLPRYSRDEKKMLWYGELSANQHPDIVDLVQELIYKSRKKNFVFDIGVTSMDCNAISIARVAANPSATSAFLDGGWLERGSTFEERKLLWSAFSSNPDPKAIRYMKENIDDVDFTWLSSNPNKRAVDILKEDQSRIDWKWISTNPAAIDLIKANPEKICHEKLCHNPHKDAIDMLYEIYEKSQSKFNYRGLLHKNFWDEYRHKYVE